MVRLIAVTGGFGPVVKVTVGKKEFRHKMILQIVKFWLIWLRKVCRLQKEFLAKAVICVQILLNFLNVIRF
ncbi:hypothetical protein D3C87_2187260 [compost metagenome]